MIFKSSYFTKHRNLFGNGLVQIAVICPYRRELKNLNMMNMPPSVPL